MNGRNRIGPEKDWRRAGKRGRKAYGYALRRGILLSKELANQTVIRPCADAQMALMGLMLRTGVTGDIGSKRQIMMVERRQQDRRQDDQQQDN